MHAFAIAMLTLGAQPAVDFDTEIVPILTKAGCNAAACHGAAAGRGGFKLSLFGGDPAADHAEIAYRLEGRRINLASPENSLLVTKPTEQIEHGGGTRIAFDGPAAKRLTRWVCEGGRRHQLRRLVELEATPRQALMSLNDELALSVIATFDDGTTRDVSELAIYDTADPGAVEIDPSGRLQVLRRGRHVVIIRFLSKVLTGQMTVPLGDEPVDLSQAARNNWIDKEILQTLAALRLSPSPQAGEEMLLRRVTLHLTGRLPRPEQVRAYTRARDPDKYRKLVDRLLESEEFIDYWTYRLGKLLRVGSQRNNPEGTQAFHNWLRHQVAKDAGWDEVAATLLTAKGDTHVNGPANFYLVAGDARAQAEYASELLMGVRLRCANCHNHPLDRWTQDDYHGLSAIFAKVKRGRNVRVALRGEVIHPGSGEAAVPRIPGERFLTDEADGRPELARWLTQPDNDYLARAMVNRIWKALMGHGLVEPTDDLRATNPPTHPQLLERLARDFIGHGYSLRHTIRTIVHSAAYARSSVPTAANQAEDRFYSHAPTTPLGAEVLVDAISDVTGVAEEYGQYERGTRAIELSLPVDSKSLDVLGGCERSDSCESSETSTGGLTTKLHLLNGPLLNRRLADPAGRLQRLRRAGWSQERILNEFHLLAFTRLPNQQEAAFWLDQIEAAQTDSRAVWEDFVWALLNSKEFLTNH